MSAIILAQALSAPGAQAITNTSFETKIENNWTLWKEPASARSYEMYRSYDSPFGYGAYSLAIDAHGQPDSRFSVFFFNKSDNSFPVQAGKTYYISFYTRSTREMNLSVFLEQADTFKSVSPVSEISVDTYWKKQSIRLAPEYSGNAILAMTFGDMPDNATLQLDGIDIFSNDFVLSTKEIKGYVGDTEKVLAIKNLDKHFDKYGIEIELPYYDHLTGAVTTKKYQPKDINASGIRFDIPEQSFSGVGHVYAAKELIGSFTLNILPKISEVSPVMARADEDLVIYGSGFSPIPDTTFVVIKSTDINGKVYDNWIKPHDISPGLKQMAIKMPAGVVAGRLIVQTAFTNAAGTAVVNKSNTADYSVKPVIFGAEWKERGYDQVGDVMTISGRGIANKPVVTLYNDSGGKIADVKAKLIEISTENGYEKIEFATSRKESSVKVTVKAGQVESDLTQALAYAAKPKLLSVKSSKNRIYSASLASIAAAKTGETLILGGEGFSFQAGSTAVVEFPGINGTIAVAVEKSGNSGTALTAVVPPGAQNGNIYLLINNQRSNGYPLEVIPKIIATAPVEPVPGYEMAITAEGVGPDKSQADIIFSDGSAKSVTVKPDTIEVSGEQTVLKAIVPLTLSSVYKVRLRYGNWTNDEVFNLVSMPIIKSASFDPDDHVLTINGSGFSSNQKENIITYMYADRTVIAPKVKFLSLLDTSEGQQLKIEILDDYYYGYIKINVKGYDSNEMNFGPAVIKRIDRRVQYVKSLDRVMGVLYISGVNMGPVGDVKVGEVWAETHYRTNTYIIAVVEQDRINGNPVIVTKR